VTGQETLTSSIPGLTEREVAVGDVRLHVREAGGGAPLLLLHTSFEYGHAWRGVIDPLADRYRLIVPDLRGCGLSQAPATGYDKETLAQDVVGVLDALDLDRVGLVGHGMGGLIGFLATLRAPERISRYLAIGVVHPWLRLDARLVASLWRSWYQPVVAAPVLGQRVARARRFLTWMLRGTSPHPENWPDETIDVYAQALAREGCSRATSLMYRTFLARELVPLVAGRYRDRRLTVPTSLVFGTRDRFFSPHALRGFEPYAERMSLDLVEGEGHFVHEERPGLVAKRVQRFFGAES
jgi:pimeloyl-ACP methyl ester carboxylesterase